MPCSTGRAAHCITAPGCQENGEPQCHCIGQSAFSATPFKGDLVDNKVDEEGPIEECLVDIAALCTTLSQFSVSGILIQSIVEQVLAQEAAQIADDACGIVTVTLGGVFIGELNAGSFVPTGADAGVATGLALQFESEGQVIAECVNLDIVA